MSKLFILGNDRLTQMCSYIDDVEKEKHLSIPEEGGGNGHGNFYSVSLSASNNFKKVEGAYTLTEDFV